MKNIRLLGLTLFMALPLAACGGNKFSDECYAFLKARGVEGVSIKFLEELKEENVEGSEVADDFYEYWGTVMAPEYYLVTKSSITKDAAKSLEDDGWNVDYDENWEDYYAVDPKGLVQVYFYDSWFSDGTEVYINTVADLIEAEERNKPIELDDGTVAEQIAQFLGYRGVENITVPYVGSIGDNDVVSIEYDVKGGIYAPYYSVALSGDRVDALKAAFTDGGWRVPEQPDETYGYECVDNDFLVEVDFYYFSEDERTHWIEEYTEYYGEEPDPEEIPALGTHLTVYAVADITE